MKNPPLKIKIKICGITTPEDGRLVAEAGADAIGLNFYEPSPRYVTAEQAAEIADVLPHSVVKVGLFVNSPIEAILKMIEQVPLDAVQLHGDEPPEFLQQLQAEGVERLVRAFRLGPEGLGPVLDYLDLARQQNALPDVVIFDSYRSGVYGGTGQTTDWATAAQFARRADRPHLLLAGGIAPENVAEAIRQVRPEGVDTASGVESSPGRKDPAMVRRFIAQARTEL